MLSSSKIHAAKSQDFHLPFFSNIISLQAGKHWPSEVADAIIIQDFIP